jgi:NAD-dependent deacetylase
MKKRIVIFSGAGLSAESGVPTFRESGGLWENHRIEDVASPQGWASNSQMVLDFYAKRFLKMRNCQPNPAHLAIAELAKHHDVVCITQNIDDLLERAGVSNVWHLHGRIDWKKCEFHEDIPAYPNDLFCCSYKDDLQEPIILGDKCPQCGAQVRPDVVWFGEAVNMRQDYLQDLVETTDVFIGVGTSAKVYPAAGLLGIFENTPEKVFIDPKPAREVLNGFKVMAKTASEAMPEYVKNLLPA